jgi:hypothetical protein
MRFHDVTATFRGNDPARPVRVGTDGNRLVLLVDQDHATDLAKVIGLGSAAAAGDLDTDPTVWNQAITDVLVAAQDIDSTVLVPVAGVAQ